MSNHSLDSVHEAFMAIERFDHIVGRLMVNPSGYMSKDLLDDERVEKDWQVVGGNRKWHLWGSDIRKNRRIPHGYAVAVGEKYKGHPRFIFMARISPSPPNGKMAKKALDIIHYMDNFDMPALSIGYVASAVGFSFDEESSRRFSGYAARLFDEDPFPRHFLEPVARARLDPSPPGAMPGFSSSRRIRDIVLSGIFEKSPRADVKVRRWRPTSPANLIHDPDKK